MKYSYEHRDIFTVEDNYVLAHCISSDFVMGAGIAKLFTNRGVKQKLLNTYPTNIWNGHGYCLPTFMKNHVVCNLVTKNKVFQKPTYETLKESLIDLREWMISACYRGRIPSLKLAMPLIGCGLDGLEWSIVEGIIKEVFSDDDLDILDFDFNILICEWP